MLDENNKFITEEEEDYDNDEEEDVEVEQQQTLHDQSQIDTRNHNNDDDDDDDESETSSSLSSSSSSSPERKTKPKTATEKVIAAGTVVGVLVAAPELALLAAAGGAAYFVNKHKGNVGEMVKDCENMMSKTGEKVKELEQKHRSVVVAKTKSGIQNGVHRLSLLRKNRFKNNIINNNNHRSYDKIYQELVSYINWLPSNASNKGYYHFSKQSAMELTDYYRNRSYLSDYTINIELPRLKNYSIYYNSDVIINDIDSIATIMNDWIDNVDNNNNSPIVILVRSANQSLFADILQQLTGESLLIRPQYYTAVTAQSSQIMIFPTTNCIRFTSQLVLSLPTSNGERWNIAQIDVQVEYILSSMMISHNNNNNDDNEQQSEPEIEPILRYKIDSVQPLLHLYGDDNQGQDQLLQDTVNFLMGQQQQQTMSFTQQHQPQQQSQPSSSSGQQSSSSSNSSCSSASSDVDDDVSSITTSSTMRIGDENNSNNNNNSSLCTVAVTTTA